MASTHERLYNEQDIDRLVKRVDDEGAAVERRSRLLGVLSRLLWQLEHATDAKDVAALEAQIMVVDEVLDGHPIAGGGVAHVRNGSDR